MIELHLYNYFIISFFEGEHKVYGRLSHGGGELYSCTQEGSGAFGAQVQAIIGLTLLMAPVPPTERAGSEGSYECCLRQQKQNNRAAPVGNAPLSLPAAVLSPKGEVLAAPCFEILYETKS